MLKHLHIENYALIESLDIDLHRGFSVITGQTGAGKSILLGAIGLLTGDRADLSAIQTGKKRCTIEAQFDLTGYGMQPLFDQEDLDWDESCCIIRRELTSAGKSRAFVNDTPVTVATLRRLGSKLLDIHSQHKNLLLGQENFQIHVLDTLAHNQQLKQQYQEAYTTWKHATQALEQARRSAQDSRNDEDYLRYQLQELDEFAPVDGEDEALNVELDTLEHSQEIRQALYETIQLLSESSNNCIDLLHEARTKLEDIANFYPPAEPIANRIECCEIELKDLARECDDQSYTVNIDPQRLEEVENRLSHYYTLEQKHHVQTSSQLVQMWKNIASRLATIDHSDENITTLQNQVDQAQERVSQLAQSLSNTRTQIAKTVETQMIKILHTLGMPNVQFKVDITPSPQPQATGQDNVNMLFSANKNAPMQAIQNVASGGEIARVMLSLKAIISASVSLPTIIFDEIDTGVSGKIAQAMAHIMQQMGQEGRQVISITHLPQIAAIGQWHYRVWKEDTEESTHSHISQLTQPQRIDEIATMLSGSDITPEAIENARQLLQITQQP